MSTRKVTDHRWLAVWLVLCAAAGCTAQPQQILQAGVMGTNGQVGPILLRSVHVEAPPQVSYPPGTDARLWFTVLNEGAETDQLVSLTSPAATRIDLHWDRGCDGRAEMIPGLPVRPAERAVGDHQGAPPFDAYHARLVGFTREVLAGTTIRVTFDFAGAGPVTLGVTVQPVGTARGEPTVRCASNPGGPR